MKNYSHLTHYLGTHELLCLHCGSRWPINSVLPNQMWVLPACMEAFNSEHRDCEAHEAGAQLKEWMEKDWETNWKDKAEQATKEEKESP